MSLAAILADPATMPPGTIEVLRLIVDHAPLWQIGDTDTWVDDPSGAGGVGTNTASIDQLVAHGLVQKYRREGRAIVLPTDTGRAVGR